jgi:hypothetical protein
MRFFVALLMFLIVLPSSASSQTLEEAIQQMLAPKTFDPSVLDDDVVVLVTSGTSRRLYDGDEIAGLAANLKVSGTENTISDFKVLSKTEAGQFVSIVYSVDWKSSLGQTVTTTHLTSHEVWERQVSGWRRLFAAMAH